MFRSLISLNLSLDKFNKLSKKTCLCTIINSLLILFIFIVSFYLIRRLNRVDINNIESFIIPTSTRNITLNVDSLKGPLNKIASGSDKVREIVNPLNKINNSLSSISGSLSRIDAKLDYVTGFKSIKSNTEITTDDDENEVDNRDRVVNRGNYPSGAGVVEEKKEEESE